MGAQMQVNEASCGQYRDDEYTQPPLGHRADSQFPIHTRDYICAQLVVVHMSRRPWTKHALGLCCFPGVLGAFFWTDVGRPWSAQALSSRAHRTNFECRVVIADPTPCLLRLTSGGARSQRLER